MRSPANLHNLLETIREPESGGGAERVLRVIFLSYLSAHADN